jgi:hypothetical protein
MPVALDDPNNPEVLLGIAKTPLAIQLELLALSTSKKNAIFSDVTSGSPPKYSAFDDWADLTVFAAFIPATSVGATMDEKMGGVAAYLLRHPHYLNPAAFDATITIIPYIPPPPVPQSATIAANGTTLTLVFDKAATAVTTWGVNVTLAGAQAATATYSSGNGTTTVVFTLGTTIYTGGILTLSIAAGAYTGAGSEPNNALSFGAVNSSTQVAPAWGNIYIIDATITVTKEVTPSLPGYAVTWISGDGQVTLGVVGPAQSSDWEITDDTTSKFYHGASWDGTGCFNVPEVPFGTPREVCFVS